jgi:hypothetical protein
VSKCRPDIFIHAIILSNCKDNPVEAHYVALKQFFTCLAATWTEGVHYSMDNPCMDLPDSTIPMLHSDNYQLHENRGFTSDFLFGYVGSDWATNAT